MSVFQSCLEQILLQIQPLLDNGSFREVAIRLAAITDAKAYPAVHLIPGDESAGEEDICGYTCTRQVLVKIVFSEYREPFAAAAGLVSAVQAAIESDTSLAGHAKSFVYRGEQPFITDATQPRAGVFLTYEMIYRRKVADPETGY
jgi:hypothetical protein